MDQELEISGDGGAEEEAVFPNRPQRRLLRRIFNGRTVPLIADGQDFLTYKQAVKYLTGQAEEVRERLYADFKQQALRQQAEKSSAAEGVDPVSPSE